MFFKKIFFKLIELYNYFVEPYKNSIFKVYLTYTHNGQLRPSSKKYNSFWKNEEWYWIRSGKDENYWVDVSGNYTDKKIIRKPKQVKNILFKLKYSYSGKNYTCINTSPCIPENSPGTMKFTYPIKEVLLKNTEDKDFNIDVSKKYIKYLGPKKNFHNCGENITVDNLFPYDGYDTIEIRDIINGVKTFKKDSSIHLLL